MFKKNDITEMEITDLGQKGEGIGKSQGITLFVDNGLPGDYCQVKILKMKKSYGYGKLIKLIKPSPHRTVPLCDAFPKCGGCSIQHINYTSQKDIKERKIKESLARIGGIANAADIVLPIVGMENPVAYRNKLQIPVRQVEGKIETGYFAKNSHRLVPARDCVIQPAKTEEIIKAVTKDFMESCGIKAYDEENHTGIVRHIVIRYGFATGEVMVMPVLNMKAGAKLRNEEQLVQSLRKIDGVVAVILNYNDKPTNVILGETVRALWGKEYVTDRIGTVTYRISPLSFFQVNPVQTKKLYDCVAAFVGEHKGETVLDAYCGIGTISLYIASQVAKVYGIESVPAAVMDAERNAAVNNINNVEFIAGEAEKVIYDLMEQPGFRPGIIIVDPPRKGCRPEMLDAMLTLSPEKIIYVSCNPDTLARDLKQLSPRYRAVSVQPVDMFPYSMNVESVTLLQLQQ